MTSFEEYENDIATKLELLDLPEIQAPLHKNRLKEALLFSVVDNSAGTNFWGRVAHRTLSIPTGNKFVKFVSLGAISMVVAAGVVSYVSYQGFSGSTPQAQAQVVAEQSITRLKNLNLSQAEQATVTHFGGLESLDKLLQSAKDAKDLIVVTYDEYTAQEPARDHLQIWAQDPAMTAKIRGGNFLEFTETDGSKVTIGIDGDNVPFMFQSIGSGGESMTIAGGISVGRPWGAPTPKDTGGITHTGSATATVATPRP